MNIQTSLCSLLFLAATTAQGAFISVSLPGTTQYDGWFDMKRPLYPEYATAAAGVGTLPSASAAWPEPFGSNTGSSGDAFLDKTAGNGYFAGTGLYQGGGAGSFTVYDDSALSGLETIVFQLEANYDGASATAPFRDGVVPTLYLNGSTTGIAANFTEYLPAAGEYLASNSIFAYQWDLSGETTPITSFSIDWNGPASSGQVTGIQLNQGTEFIQAVGLPVPEPTAALLGVASLGVLSARRRRKNA